MIYLIRHGLDDERYIGGWSDISLISDGINQIENASKFIVDNSLNINKIISSDIKRAKETSYIVKKYLNVDIIYDSRLRELDKGYYTGILKSELSKKEVERIKKFNIYDEYPNGESMYDLFERMKVYLKSIKDDNILLVTHRGVINMFYYILNDIKLDMDKEKFSVVHGSIHEMDISKKLIRRIF